MSPNIFRKLESKSLNIQAGRTKERVRKQFLCSISWNFAT